MSEAGPGDRYAAAGVDYDVLDAGKRAALAAAASSAPFGARRGAAIDPRSYGEPAAVVALGSTRLGIVLECLGTKSLLARDVEALTGDGRWDAIGYDTVAAAVNDCCCVGALPFMVHAYVATGSAGFYDGDRHAALIAGFLRGCTDAGATWGGGESPTLAGLVAADAAELAASSVGLFPDGVAPLLGDALVAGDEIVLVASSGLHQNGASLARLVASEDSSVLTAPLADGRGFGAALLDPGLIYVRLVEALADGSFPLHYCSHLTGHGLRKLMRADRELGYELDALLPVPPVLERLATLAGLSPAEAYGTLNMGAGFALFVGSGAGADAAEVATSLGYSAIVAGRVTQGPRRVVIGPLDVNYEAASLELR